MIYMYICMMYICMHIYIWYIYICYIDKWYICIYVWYIDVYMYDIYVCIYIWDIYIWDIYIWYMYIYMIEIYMIYIYLYMLAASPPPRSTCVNCYGYWCVKEPISSLPSIIHQISTQCAVCDQHSVLLSKSVMVDANCFISGKKTSVVKGTCCLQATICLDDISSSKK